jgi:hypothetical protein
MRPQAENLLIAFDNELYDDFWKLLLKGMGEVYASKTITLNDVRDILKHISENEPLQKIQKMFDKGQFISFAEGFKYFFEAQKTIDIDSISSSISPDFANVTMLSCASLHRADLMAFFNQFRPEATRNLGEFQNHIKRFLDRKDYEAFDLLLSSSGDVKRHSSALLSKLNEHAASYEQLSYFINKYQLDINSTYRSYSDVADSGVLRVQSFAHHYINSSGSGSNQNALRFITDFGDTISLDNTVDYYRILSGKHIHTEDIFHYMKDNKSINGLDILQRYSTLLEHCHFQEKHIVSLADVVMKSANLVTYSQNSFYQTFFSQPLLKSNLIDKHIFLEAIFNADVSENNREAFLKNNQSSNPVSFVLQTFLQQVDLSNTSFIKNPLIIWAEKQNKKYFSSTMFSLLYEKFGHNMQSLSLQDTANILNKELLVQFEQKGIKVEKKQSFFKSFFGNSNENTFSETPTIARIEESKVEQPVAANKQEVFNHDLYQRVNDNDLKQYIEAILLNSEQFNFLCDTQSQMENDHYMNNLLPKFLNKTVENYLYFATMNEPEAKLNALTQLQLLNKKTFSVLNADLENAKEMAERENRVHTAIIKQYRN